MRRAQRKPCRQAGVAETFVRPIPWQIIRNGRRAVMAGFFCRREPAAPLLVWQRRLSHSRPGFGVEILEIGHPVDLTAHPRSGRDWEFPLTHRAFGKCHRSCGH